MVGEHQRANGIHKCSPLEFQEFMPRSPQRPPQTKKGNPHKSLEERTSLGWGSSKAHTHMYRISFLQGTGQDTEHLGSPSHAPICNRNEPSASGGTQTLRFGERGSASTWCLQRRLFGSFHLFSDSAVLFLGTEGGQRKAMQSLIVVMPLLRRLSAFFPLELAVSAQGLEVVS